MRSLPCGPGLSAMGREGKARLLLGLGRREAKQAARVGYLSRAGENGVHWAERGVWVGKRNGPRGKKLGLRARKQMGNFFFLFSFKPFSNPIKICLKYF